MLAFPNNLQWVSRLLVRIDIFAEIAKSEDSVVVRRQIVHEGFKFLWGCIDPRVSEVWYSMELQNRDATVPRLRNRADEIRKFPLRFRVTRRWNEQRVIATRLERISASRFVVPLRFSTTSSEANSLLSQYGERLKSNRIPGVSK